MTIAQENPNSVKPTKGATQAASIRFNQTPTRSDLEKFLTGKLKLERDAKAKLLDALARFFHEPLNTKKAGEIFLEIVSGDHLALAGNEDEFFQKLFGWKAEEGKNIIALYKSGRWADVVVPVRRDEVAEEPAATHVMPDSRSKSASSKKRNAKNSTSPIASGKDAEFNDAKPSNEIAPPSDAPFDTANATVERSSIAGGRNDGAKKHDADQPPQNIHNATTTEGASSSMTEEIDSPPTDADLGEVGDAPEHHAQTNGAPISTAGPDATANARRTSEQAAPVGEMITPTKSSAGQPAELEIVHPGGAKKGVAKQKTKSTNAVNRNREKLSKEERTLLEQCQDVIFEGQDTFVRVGNAIATIIEKKLYRETHKKFADYAEEVLGMSPRRAYQLKDANDVICHLKKVNSCSRENDCDADLPMPTNEGQIRALKNYSPKLQYEIWCEAVAASERKPVTAKKLAEIILARNDTPHPKSMDEQDATESIDADDNADIAEIMAMLRASQNWPSPKRQILCAMIKEWLETAR